LGTGQSETAGELVMQAENVLERVFAPRAWAGAAIAPRRGAAVELQTMKMSRSR